jgi:hypothetical protein
MPECAGYLRLIFQTHRHIGLDFDPSKPPTVNISPMCLCVSHQNMRVKVPVFDQRKGALGAPAFPLPTPYSLLPTPCSLLPTPYFPLPPAGGM